MTTRTIVEYPDPFLRRRADKVEQFDDNLASMVEDLVDTLYAGACIGLSAPQIGDPRAVLVIDLSEDRSAPEVYINPEITGSAGFAFTRENCLSVPGIGCNVMRSATITVAAQAPDGTAFERDLSDMHAVCVQHEMDHLAGILLVDHLSWFGRLRLKLSPLGRRPVPAPPDHAAA